MTCQYNIVKTTRYLSTLRTVARSPYSAARNSEHSSKPGAAIHVRKNAKSVAFSVCAAPSTSAGGARLRLFFCGDSRWLSRNDGQRMGGNDAFLIRWNRPYRGCYTCG